MRVVELSNHPGALLNQARKQRAVAQQRARSEFEFAIAEHRTQLADATRLRDLARSQRRWVSWLRNAWRVRRLGRLAPLPSAAVAALSDNEQMLAAGVAGEQLIEAGLGRALGNEWTLLRGYRNRRGEIDHLLIGPCGIIAIEGKHLNATVHCDADTWWFDKYDRYGNLVEQGKLRDKRGRSPSAQLNEPASLLEDFLRCRDFRIPVQRVVLLTHQKSRLGTCRNPSVAMATSTRYVLDLTHRLPPVLNQARLAKLEQLIINDHRYHQAKRTR